MGRQCVSSRWPMDWFGYLHNLYIDIWFTFKSLIDGVCHLVYLNWPNWGKGWPVVACPFWALVVLYRMSPYLLNMKCLMYGLLFLLLSPSKGCFQPQTFFLKTDWTGFHRPPLYHINILQYIPRNMHTVFALLCFVVVIHWLIFPYPSGLLHWHCGNLTIVPVPAKQPWWIWLNTSCEFIMNDCITTTKQSTTKPCAYFLGYTVYWG